MVQYGRIIWEEDSDITLRKYVNVAGNHTGPAAITATAGEASEHRFVLPVICGENTSKQRTNKKGFPGDLPQKTATQLQYKPISK